MTDPLVGSLDRLRELAREGAYRLHDDFCQGRVNTLWPHSSSVDLCPHPDCTLVRELVPVPPAPQPCKFIDGRCIICHEPESGMCNRPDEPVSVPPAPSGAPFSSPFNEILAERLAQDHQWGGSRHDDTHTTDDWSHYIQKQLNETEGGESHLSQARARYVKIAALAVAAAESIARRLEGVAAPAPSAPQPAIDLLRRLRGWDMFNPPWNCADGAFWVAEIDKVLAAASGLSPSAETQSTK